MPVHQDGNAGDQGVATPAAGRPVYAISVAAELTGLGVQTLRLYEARGLITPARSAGGTRCYSGADLARLHRITALNQQGINLTAIARILELEDANADLTARCDRLQARLDEVDSPDLPPEPVTEPRGGR
ncbi:MerR family transcriptional regulator [Nocardia higoensis]|uniref:MerR family transcriptional regulator n=1 Tax=Nocardia higoensis TaxID=228599 RepID=A0ABS0D5F0_9NOCA|nr:MerR family transcriptional regulator [Nocardia higoensis]MBF6353700.1 MerR family transcriptional regulator [Nocardia higoensis]